MSEIFMNTSVESQKYIDGELIDDKSLHADYDGNILNIDIKDNHDKNYTTLNNEELLSLFSAPNDNKTIHERLNDAFPILKTLKTSKPTRRKNKLIHYKKNSSKNKNKSSKNKKKSTRRGKIK